MHSHFVDQLHILTRSPERGQEIQQSIVLRGFDQIKCFLLSQPEAILAEALPDLLIIDGEGDETEARLILQHYLTTPPTLFLSNRFDEEAFISAHDAGARDYLIYPIHQSYLTARILLALDHSHMAEKLREQNQLLQDLQVIGTRSNVYTAPYIAQKIEHAILSRSSNTNLCLLLIKLPDTSEQIEALADVLRSSCRSSDCIGEFDPEAALDGLILQQATDSLRYFVMLCPNTTEEGATIVVNRIQNLIQTLSLKLQKPLQIELSDFSNCNTLADWIQKVLPRFTV